MSYFKVIKNRVEVATFETKEQAVFDMRYRVATKYNVAQNNSHFQISIKELGPYSGNGRNFIDSIEVKFNGKDYYYEVEEVKMTGRYYSSELIGKLADESPWAK